MDLESSRIAGNFRNEKGMTLIELILSAAILSLLLVALYTFLVTGMKIYNQSWEDLSNLQNARYAMNRLSIAISQARDVKVVSNSKIEVTLADCSKVYYYLEYGTLYREKNGGKNPVAELSFLEFRQNSDSKLVKIVLKAGKERDITFKTSVTPFGALIRGQP